MGNDQVMLSYLSLANWAILRSLALPAQAPQKWGVAWKLYLNLTVHTTAEFST